MAIERGKIVDGPPVRDLPDGRGWGLTGVRKIKILLIPQQKNLRLLQGPKGRIISKEPGGLHSQRPHREHLPVFFRWARWRQNSTFCWQKASSVPECRKAACGFTGIDHQGAVDSPERPLPPVYTTPALTKQEAFSASKGSENHPSILCK